jgi:hypothetical protein
MANESTDVLMTFINSSGGVAAECASVWNVSDSMKADFSAGSFFEVEDFSFKGGLDVEDPDKNKPRTGFAASEGGNGLSDRGTGTGTGTGSASDQNKSGSRGRGSKFAKYVMGIKGWEKGYSIEVPEITITRQMDAGSPILFSSCLNLVSFTKAILVKRKIIGGMASQGVTVPLMGFLRIEFDQPLITGVDWDDGEVVKEKLTFVCRGGTVIYKPQKPDGTLGAQVSVSWTPRLQLEDSQSSGASQSSGGDEEGE